MSIWKPALLTFLFGSLLGGTGCRANRSVGATGESSALDYAPGGAFSTPAVDKPRLVRVYFNPYTDSIKTVLNYYVNVEGEYSDGSYLPLDSSTVELRCDHGVLEGNAWVIPKKIDFEKVTFTAVSRENPQLRDTVTLWIQKWKDPRDAPDYKDPDEARERR